MTRGRSTGARKPGRQAIFLLDERGRELRIRMPRSRASSTRPLLLDSESAVYMDGDRGFFRPVPRTGAAGAETASSAPGAPGSPAAEELLPAGTENAGKVTSASTV